MAPVTVTVAAATREDEVVPTAAGVELTAAGIPAKEGESHSERARMQARPPVHLPPLHRRVQPWVDARDDLRKRSLAILGPSLLMPLFQSGTFASKWIFDGTPIDLLWIACLGAGCLLTAGGGSGAAFVIAFTLAFVPRNSILTLVFGWAFERAIRIHKYLGVLAIGPMLIHGFNYGLLGIGDSEGRDDDRRFRLRRRLDGDDDEDMVFTGTAAVAAYLALLLFALPPVRRFAWEFFHLIHVALAAVFLVFVLLHGGAGTILPALALVAADWLIRGVLLARGGGKVVSAETFGDITVIKIDKCEALSSSSPSDLGAAGAGGRFGFVQLPRAAGWQPHPLSYASLPGDSQVTLAVKSLGGWSKRAQSVACGDAVRLEGPYGCPAVPYALYERVVLLAGGVGITGVLSVALDLLYRGGNAKAVELHWSATSVETFRAFEKELSQILGGRDACSFAVQLYCSRLKEKEGAEGGLHSVAGITVMKERLGAKKILAGALSDSSSDIGVLCCGPHSLIRAAQQAASTSKSFHFHEEIFEY